MFDIFTKHLCIDAHISQNVQAEIHYFSIFIHPIRTVYQNITHKILSDSHTPFKYSNDGEDIVEIVNEWSLTKNWSQKCFCLIPNF